MDDYLVMVDNKTGGFFRFVLRCMATEAPVPPSSLDKLIYLTTLYGRYYQIRDDYQNLMSDEVGSRPIYFLYFLYFLFFIH
jgi:geranylgeranyl diphosphate synthase type 3